MTIRARTLAILLAAAASCAGAAGCRRAADALRPAGATAQAPARPGRDEARPGGTPRDDGRRTLPALARGLDAFEPVIRLGGGRRFETRRVEKRLTRKKFLASADYPQLAGDAGRAALDFNRRARALALGEIEDYLDDRPDPEKERSPHWKDVEERHGVSSEVVFATDELVSVLFYVQGYSWGAAHGYHQPRTLNYDLARGRALELADLFRPDSDHLRVVARYCAEDLSRQLGRDVGRDPAWGDGVKPEPKNYRSWLLTAEGLVILFEEYQVAAYAEGEPKVLIPYESLRDVIRPRGPLASLSAPR